MLRYELRGLIPGVLVLGAVLGVAAVDRGCCCGGGGGGAAGNGEDGFGGAEPGEGSFVRGVEAEWRRSSILSLYASLREEMEPCPSLHGC